MSFESVVYFHVTNDSPKVFFQNVPRTKLMRKYGKIQQKFVLKTYQSAPCIPIELIEASVRYWLTVSNTASFFPKSDKIVIQVKVEVSAGHFRISMADISYFQLLNLFITFRIHTFSFPEYHSLLYGDNVVPDRPRFRRRWGHRYAWTAHCQSG